MESALWAINLCAVVYLCFWAIKEDDKLEVEENMTQTDAAQAEKVKKGIR